MAKGTWKTVNHDEWHGRLTKGRHFLSGPDGPAKLMMAGPS
jgi:hypothetical protein